MQESKQKFVYSIDVSHLNFSYPDGQTALKDICFKIAPSEKVALVGANGSGKSTLLMHLNGILRANTGTIAINGLILKDKALAQIRALVGVLFQNADDQLFSTTVEEDVAFAPYYMGLPETEITNRVERALAQVGMSDYAKRMSYHLSIGEKKRIALASILSAEPGILILDEPSSGLDPRGRRRFMELVKTFREQTVLISTHDMRLAADLCTRTIVLDNGEVIADGDTRSILFNRELMEAHGLETPEQ